MQLDKIVETTFLPPPMVRTEESSEVFEYQCIKSGNSFFPCFNTQDKTFYVEKDGKDATVFSSGKTLFSSEKQLRKHCWLHFYKIRNIYFKPKVEKHGRKT